MIQQRDKEKIAKLMAMLSSDNDGEILNAVSAIKRTLKSNGSDFYSLGQELFAPRYAQRPNFEQAYKSARPPPPPPKKKLIQKDVERLAVIRLNMDKLGEKETEFIDSITIRIAKGTPLTEKQEKWFQDIFKRF